MAETPNRPTRDLGFFRAMIDQGRVSWALFTDSRVPLLLKAIPLGALAYVISPIDAVPDVFPILGQLDDIGILMGAMSLFNTLAPADIVTYHLERLHMIDSPRLNRRDDGITIDVKAKNDKRQ
jgi:uncharacterized membrane protein YkvA (DUF1232 family)